MSRESTVESPILVESHESRVDSREPGIMKELLWNSRLSTLDSRLAVDRLSTLDSRLAVERR